MNDPFDVLGISSDADPETVEEAYRRLAQIYHPDRFGSSSAKGVREEAERRMKAVNEARDEIRRRHVDRPSPVPRVTLECPKCSHREGVEVPRARSARCSSCGAEFSSSATPPRASSTPGASQPTSTSPPRPSTPSAGKATPPGPAAAAGSSSAGKWVLGLIVVGAALFFAQRESSPAPLRQDDISQVAANLAFAQQAYEKTHGTYTSDVEALEVEIEDERIEVAAFASGTEFCVQASADGRTYATWHTQFKGDEVTMWQRSCGGSPTAPEFTEPGFKQDQQEQLVLLEQIIDISFEFDAEKEFGMGRGLAINKACWDGLEAPQVDLETEMRSIENKDTLTTLDISRAREVLREYKRIVNRQWNC